MAPSTGVGSLVTGWVEYTRIAPFTSNCSVAAPVVPICTWYPGAVFNWILGAPLVWMRMATLLVVPMKFVAEFVPLLPPKRQPLPKAACTHWEIVLSQ